MSDRLCDGCDCFTNKPIFVELSTWVQKENNNEEFEKFEIAKALCPTCYEAFKQQVQSFFKWQGNKHEGME